MMRSTAILVLFIWVLILNSCDTLSISPEENESFNNSCDVSNPLEDIPWLKAKIDEAESEAPTEYCSTYSIIQGVYNDQAAFIVILNGALCCTCGNTVYDCQGEILFSCNLDEEEKVSGTKIIWKKD